MKWHNTTSKATIAVQEWPIIIASKEQAGLEKNLNIMGPWKKHIFWQEVENPCLAIMQY